MTRIAWRRKGNASQTDPAGRWVVLFPVVKRKGREHPFYGLTDLVSQPLSDCSTTTSCTSRIARSAFSQAALFRIARMPRSESPAMSLMYASALMTYP